MWLHHPSFDEHVQENWHINTQGSPSYLLHSKLKTCSRTLTQWNRAHFGHLDRQINEVKQQLQDIQQQQNDFQNVSWGIREKELHARLRWLLKRKADHWKQKSRINWVKEGDANTRFFHLSTIKRRYRNHIHRLKLHTGEWIEEMPQIKKAVQDHFQNLFLTSNPTIDTNLLSHLPTSITAVENDMLDSVVTREEIMVAFNQMDPGKSPGPDGFPGSFYKHCWTTVGEDLIQMVMAFFQHGTFTLAHNHTHIVLIPKTKRPITLNDFRPISLCNLTYKLVTKIIVNRMRPLLQRIISYNQTAFLPKRSINDNIIMVREIMHYIKHAKPGKSGSFALKLDLHKAYDKLECTFIRAALLKAGFSTQWTEKIMFCITGLTQAILVNGAATPIQKSTRGIRQGCPLSPYIFILCAQVLSSNLDSLQQTNKFRGIKLARSCPPITHVMYADDLIICGKTNTRECQALKTLLDTFCSSSGLTINLQKSAWYHHPRMLRGIISSTNQLLQVHHSSIFKKYLGVPVIFGRSKQATFNETIAKVTNKLTGWKSNFLTQAGRTTLIQSVMAATPTHIMSTTRLPVGTTNRLDQLQRNFFWGHDDKTRKMHLVNWETICRPKNKGGLGIRQSSIMNSALLLKKTWEINHQQLSVLHQFVYPKYLFQRDFMQVTSRTTDSTQWKMLLSQRPFLQQGMQWSIGNGSRCPLWDRNWIPFVEQDEWPPPSANLTSSPKVNTIMNSTGTAWDTNWLAAHVSTAVQQKIAAIPLMGIEHEDQHLWGESNTGGYTVKSGAIMLMKQQHNHIPTNPIWNTIWKIKASNKIKFFAWRLLNSGLATSDKLQTRGMAIDARCGLCGQQALESHDHLFVTCSYAKAVWGGTEFSSLFQQRSPHSINQWIQMLIEEQPPTQTRDLYQSLILYILWGIWGMRNNHKFKAARVDPNVVWQQASTLATEFINQDATNGNQQGEQTPERWIHWHKPPFNWLKMNSDGASRGNPGRAAAGAVLRDEDGNFVRGMAKCIGYGNSLCAELWGVLIGLKNILDMNQTPTIVEVDCTTVIQLLNTEDVSLIPWRVRGLIIQIWEIRAQWRTINFIHTVREGNQVADALANYALDNLPAEGLEEVQVWNIAPSFLNNVLLGDRLCCTTLRV